MRCLPLNLNIKTLMRSSTWPAVVGIFISVVIHAGLLLWVGLGLTNKAEPTHLEPSLIHVTLMTESTPLLPTLAAEVTPQPTIKSVVAEAPADAIKKPQISTKRPHPIEERTLQNKTEQVTPNHKSIDESTHTEEQITKASKPPSSSPVASKPPIQSEFTTHTKEAKKSYLASLRAAINTHKYYPMRAKRMRKEGKVWIAFIVYRDGRIEQIVIQKSSGEPILDRAARKSVLRLGRYQPFPREIDVASLSVVLPVNYTVR